MFKVISGGQTGADQAGLRAARAAGLATGGFMPLGYKTEAGPRPDFAGLYGACEFSSDAYPPRTRANVAQADALIWFGNPHSPGGKLTLRTCEQEAVPHMVIITCAVSPADAADWVADQMIGVEDGVLMIAGNRESSAPGIGERVERYLASVFRLAREADGRAALASRREDG